MVIINSKGYVQRFRKQRTSKGSTIWLVKQNSLRTGKIVFKGFIFPEKYIGKRVRFKVEIVD